MIPGHSWEDPKQMFYAVVDEKGNILTNNLHDPYIFWSHKGAIDIVASGKFPNSHVAQISIGLEK